MSTPVDVAVDAAAELGEGPCWDARGRCLIWVDLLADLVHVSDVDAARTRTIRAQATVGAAVPRESGGMVAAVPGGFAAIHDDGSLAPIASIAAEPTDNRMNDGKCGPDGSFWAGSMSRDNTPAAGSLYRLWPDHTVDRVLGDLTISNGIGWSPDGGSIYFIDTATQGVDILVPSGETMKRSRFVDIPTEFGVPDGLTVDAAGNIWVAMCFGGRVLRYDDEGHLTGEIAVPATLTTSVAFGGDDLNLLFITTGRTGLSADQLSDQPHAGSVFVTKPGAPGQPNVPYAG